MDGGTFPKVLKARTNAPFEDAWQFFTGSWSTPTSLAGATARFAMVPVAGTIGGTTVDPIQFSTSDYLVVSGNSITAFVPKAIVAAWPPCSYEVEFEITFVSGSVLTLLGIMSVEKGIG